MVFYTVKEPYFALVAAKDREEARKMHIEDVADDDNGFILETMTEVSRDYALVVFAQSVRDDTAKCTIPQMCKRVIDDFEYYEKHSGFLCSTAG